HMDPRLSQISTQWSQLRQAFGSSSHTARSSMDATIERHCGAVYRYLLGATRDEEAAEELFQEFALRFLRGDFANVRPERGRFRRYLKTVLINMVNDLHRER